MLKSAKELVASVTREDIVAEIDQFTTAYAENKLLGELIAGYEGFKPDRFLELYNYALDGELDNIVADREWFDDGVSLCAMVETMFSMFDQISGFVATHDGIDVLHDAAFGRFNVDMARIGHESQIDGACQISLRQISILCRMKEASIRNALSKDPHAPVGRKAGKQVYFDPSRAHEWMLQRRGYKPTILPDDSEMVGRYRDSIQYGPAYSGGEEIDLGLDIS